MTRVEKKLKLSDEKVKRRIGTTKPVFQTMLQIERPKKAGRLVFRQEKVPYGQIAQHQITLCCGR
jgi:hypothetical protein